MRFFVNNPREQSLGIFFFLAMKKTRLMGSSSSNSVTSSIQRLTGTHLTDDSWSEIFLHLPIDSIYRFRCVSKIWLSILSNPNFIKKWYKLNTASLWTLVHASSRYEEIPSFIQDGYSSTRKFTLSYPESSSQFIYHHYGFSFMFLKQIHDFQNTNLYIVGSSNGLVLCTTDHIKQNTYYVCNPLTKRWVLLPPVPLQMPLPPIIIGNSYVVAGFTCEEDPCSSSLISPTFKVIRVPIFYGGISSPWGFKVEIFSSDLGEWNVYDVSNPPNVSWEFPKYDNFVTLDGVFYWMQKASNNIVAFGVNRNSIHGTRGNECRLINLPGGGMDDKNMYLSQCLGESEGLICYAKVEHMEMSLSVWVLEEDWYLLYKDVKFNGMLAHIKSLLAGVESSDDDLIRKIQILGFNPVDKNVVILVYEKYVWDYNIRTGGYEEFSHLCFIGSSLSTPYLSALTFAIKPRPTILPPVSW